MIERLDGGCKAKIILATKDTVLFRAFWPATKSSDKEFNVVGGIASNTVEVSREYFERRYGVSP